MQSPPRILDSPLDSKKDLDRALLNATETLISLVIKNSMDALVSFVTKVRCSLSLVDSIQALTASPQVSAMKSSSSQQATQLRSQPFAEPGAAPSRLLWAIMLTHSVCRQGEGAAG